MMCRIPEGCFRWRETVGDAGSGMVAVAIPHRPARSWEPPLRIPAPRVRCCPIASRMRPAGQRDPERVRRGITGGIHDNFVSGALPLPDDADGPQVLSLIGSAGTGEPNARSIDLASIGQIHC